MDGIIPILQLHKPLNWYGVAEGYISIGRDNVFIYWYTRRKSLYMTRLNFIFPGDGDSDGPYTNPDEGNQDTSAAEKRLDFFMTAVFPFHCLIYIHPGPFVFN